ncbi:ribonuclease R [Acidobacteria bacterium AH-259-G07]|nr:ribonuclease R [Acidobacteria bacterium AH-259-G07]
MARRKTQATVTGRLVCHPDGYGFVIPEDASLSGDVFIPPQKMGSAVDGDTVGVRLVPPRRARRKKEKGSLEGEIVRVISRAREAIVGKLFRYRKDTYVAPLDQRYHYMVRLVDARAEKVADGKIVAVSIVAQPGRHQVPLGEISEVLGDPDDPEIQYKIVCHNSQIPMDFPQEVLREAQAAEEPDQGEIKNRADFRNLPTVTIDGESARDFDDAVSIQRLENGNFRLWVHIADVCHYVAIGSRLDAEALLRGTSVYFPDRAVPMLPEGLSNELCSLNPGVDRLTVSVVLEVNPEGQVQDAQFCRSVICSNERMTYSAVKEILIDRDQGLRERYDYLLESFEWMLELCRILTAKRVKRGTIDFDLPEAEIEYDINGEILDIVRSERNEAHRIIEEFMLLANETVAQYLEQCGVLLIYRVHEDPDPAKVERFLEIAAKFGYWLEQNQEGRYPSRTFQKLMRKLSGKPEEQFLSYLMLRSFKQARYSEVNQGHFGLAAPCYTHFTSPIRRYPDLVVHRILKMAIDRDISGSEAERLYERLHEIALRSTERELKAVEAEREIRRWLMAKFMAERLGEEYEAFIIGVKRNGFFVELFEHFVEGFVPIETMWDDFYVFNKRHHCLIGENTKKVYRIGDRVRVRVDKVNPYRHLIEFSPVITQPQSRRKRK